MNDLNKEDAKTPPVKQSNNQALWVMVAFVVMIVFIIGYEIYTRK